MKRKTPFKKLWTLEVVRQIKKEFLAAKGEAYICNGSRTFESIWQHHGEKIKRLGATFRPKACVRFGIDCAFLFYNAASARATRLAFLNHEIKRLSK